MPSSTSPEQPSVLEVDFSPPSVQILVGSCTESLRGIPDRSVRCCVTSPPYFGLRDYGINGQFGLEATPEEYMGKMVAVMREVRRVLTDDGTLWLNLGDSYATSGGAHGGRSDNQRGVGAKVAHDAGAGDQSARRAPSGLKPKDLIGIPWRVAFALQADGWWLREEIIWHKPNPMPEPVKDRCTRSHEHIFHLAKSEKYYHDADAIKEPAIYSGLNKQDESGFRRAGDFNGKHAANPEIRHDRGNKQRGHSRRHDGFNARWDAMERKEQCSGMRNKRDVWTVAPATYKGAHFATFPPKLIEPCVLAGSAAGDTVLDPFGGSGTTAEVAVRHGRSAILCEINPAYVELARTRLGLPLEIA